MKKSFILLLCVIIIFALSACKPANMDDEVYQLGIKALKAADSYIILDKEGKDTYEILGKIYNEIGNTRDSNKKDKKEASDTVRDTQTINVLCDVSYLQSFILIDYSAKVQDSLKHVREARNDLAMLLNEPAK